MTVSAVRPRHDGMLAGLRDWAQRVHLYRKLAFAVAVLAVASGIATAVYWSGAAKDAADVDTVLFLLLLDVALMLVLGVLVAVRLARVWAERRKGLAGSGLLVRMVVMFGLVAVTPAILVAVFSALFLRFGLQAWFSEQVRTAVFASSAVAEAYLEAHRNSIRAEAFAMANDLNRDVAELMGDPRLFNHRLSLQANLRSLPEAIVVDSNGRILAQTPFSMSLQLDVGLVPRRSIELADRGQVAFLTEKGDNRVRAAVKLDRFVDAYLVVGRFIDPDVQSSIDRTAQAVARYQSLEERREDILVTFVLIFVVVAILLLLAAVWTGLTLSTQITEPISELIAAADRIRKGDLGVRVEASEAVEEIDTLGRAFNRMTSQLESQRDSLIVANRQLDERRRFTETVLSGVSAGVIGLDGEGRINLPNRSASDLLGTDLTQAVGAPLRDVVPEMANLLDRAMASPDRTWEAETSLIRDGRAATIIVRIVAERVRNEVVGFVATFDDISPLVSAQRKAAWADVARRVAHEIKNPLTPIQLAAERLKRKYGRHIQSDVETFDACVETIGRRVEDIRRMVDEFSSFARMPRPELHPENLQKLIRDACFQERTRSPAIRFELDLPDEPAELHCDARQISQALTNVLKNASEAILEKTGVGEGPRDDGCIRITLVRRAGGTDGEVVLIRVEDNGPGLPTADRDRLTEPYVTARAKGTGLGLAIVRKIMEDHNGELSLEDREGGGARVTLVFRVSDGTRAAEAAGSSGAALAFAGPPPVDGHVEG